MPKKIRSKDSCCSDKGEKECGGHACGCCSGHAEIDVSTLGPEAVELAKKFEMVNDNLVSALKARKDILEMVHTAKSPEIKEKLDKVLTSRHPVLIQFVFGQ
ncbi:MAG: hypothetical protein U0R44_02315 [Candidatus Micrarchaeia archaeon]